MENGRTELKMEYGTPGAEMSKLERIAPNDIEKRSFEIIDEIIGAEYPNAVTDERYMPIIRRAIHTTADFSYLETLCFSENVIDKALAAINNRCTVITDTNMAMAGINKRLLAEYGAEIICYMADDEVAVQARQRGITRAAVSMEKAARLAQSGRELIFVIGNAPTALVRLYELIMDCALKPQLIIGAPVGFVNVVQSKELIMQTDTPYIMVRGRKGGSNVAAAIFNALLYMKREGGVLFE